ncbi:Clavaminate synthase-like protein [Polychaeton citri CBS 116435]|uniref:Clavaminate synthase-like protein n=1 Tax=Polychaeton citri CBS 116435 TaxID=1314669 RepID=A0A9P4Q6G1_9PEZI|nr:Clavaminate synthase-like protein [Polychaeton citri CBS 116435]
MGDHDECMVFLKACQTQGFMYFGLRGCGTILKDWELVQMHMDKFFDQPLEVKMQDDCQSDTRGYEPYGTSTGVHYGEKDGFESFKCIQFIAVHLSNALGLEDGSRLSEFHRENEPCLSTLSMFHYPKQDPSFQGSGHNKHTDLGSLTFLFSQQWGLQVLSPNSNGWIWVEPSSTHAVINVGGSLRFLSRYRLESAVHRVVPTEHIRAESNAQYTDATGCKCWAKAWQDTEFDVFRQSHAEQELHSFTTGGMEKGDVLVS